GLHLRHAGAAAGPDHRDHHPPQGLTASCPAAAAAGDLRIEDTPMPLNLQCPACHAHFTAAPVTGDNPAVPCPPSPAQFLLPPHRGARGLAPATPCPRRSPRRRARPTAAVRVVWPSFSSPLAVPRRCCCSVAPAAWSWRF